MFEHLKNFKPDGTAWLEMPELGTNAELELRPATEQNQPYYNAMLKMAGKRARTMIRGKISTQDVEKNRNEDRRLYPKYVLVGWKGVEDDQGNPIEFTPEFAAELCQKLPDHLFDRVRNFAATPEEFYPEDEVLPDPEELAGN